VQRRGVSFTSPGTILVLEENAAVQELIDQALRECGDRVLSTKDPLEALEVVRRLHVDVLVVDVPFDERTRALVGDLRSIQPGLRTVSICGADDDLPKTDRSVRLLSPVSLDDLREAVTASLDHREER
jgi:CheY-like chemotaxis protein